MNKLIRFRISSGQNNLCFLKQKKEFISNIPFNPFVSARARNSIVDSEVQIVDAESDDFND